MIGFRPLPAREIFPLNRVSLLGRARLGQGMMMPQQQQQLSPADNLAQNGAIFQVNVSVPSSYAQGGGQGTPKTLTAMIDSGASISCITTQQAQAINLPQVSSTQLGGVGGSTQAPVYAVALNIPQFGVTVDPVQIAGVSNPLPGVDMLIGRDVLRSGSGGLIFTYHGGQGSFNVAVDTAGGAAPAPGAPAAPPAPGQPMPAQPLQQGTPPGAPMQQAGAPPPPAPGTAAAPPAPQGNLPQPPAGGGGGGTVLGMKPAVAAGVGAGVLAAGAGALALFKVI